MTIKQSRYITADTTGKKEMAIRTTELDKVKDDPFVRKSEVQQTVNNSTLPVSSRAVNLAIEQINSNLDLKADKSELDGLATEDYVNEKIDEKEIGITEAELISKSIGSDRWMREGAYGVGDSSAGGSLVPDGVIRRGIYFNSLNKDVQTPIGMQSSVMIGGDGGTAGAMLFIGRDSVLQVKSRQNGVWGEWYRTFSERDTFPDTNGYLSTSKNPITTLTVSDMADTVVDNDLITVTSGAVFRAIKQLTDQIISLETRVRELEDGGA